MSRASPKWCIKLTRPCMGDDPVGLRPDRGHPRQSPQCIDRRDIFSSLGVKGCLFLYGAHSAGKDEGKDHEAEKGSGTSVMEIPGDNL